MDFKQVHYITIDADHHRQRIDNFLIAYLKKVPKGMIYKLIRKGQVRVNSKRVKPTCKLVSGDQVRIPPIRFAETALQKPSAYLQQLIRQCIIFENDDFLVLNKPSGLSVHGGSDSDTGVIEILKSSERAFVELVHRLDKPTSGCLLVAKNRIALTGLQQSLKQGDFEKRYLALTYGKWHRQNTTVCKPIAIWKKRNQEKLMKTAADGKYAQSRFSVVKQFRHWSLTEVELETGRTHQIRVHAASEGHALAGDSKYAPEQVVRQAQKDGIYFMCLHANELSFDFATQHHHFKAEMPARFTQLLERLP